jgi:hypothetical protein
VVTVQPTYQQTGNKRYTCTDCGETKDEVLAKLPEPEVTYTVYHGSLMQSVDLTNIENIKALNKTSSKSFSSTFKKGTNRFVVAFPSAFASSITVTDETSNFGFTLDSTELVRMTDVSIDGLTYKVYAYTVGQNKADTTMSVNLK